MAASNPTRTEKDSLGTKEIPANVYYGIQTVRAMENFPISGMRAHPTLIHAMGMIKQAAAEAKDRKSTRLNSSHIQKSRMPSSA